MVRKAKSRKQFPNPAQILHNFCQYQSISKLDNRVIRSPSSHLNQASTVIHLQIPKTTMYITETATPITRKNRDSDPDPSY